MNAQTAKLMVLTGEQFACVKVEGRASANVPVYLYAVDPEVRRRIHGVRSIRSSPTGTYTFTNLPPGRYQLIATYDLDEINAATLQHAHATEVVLEEGKTATTGLELHQVR